MPIHVKAEAASLAECCLVPGDPDRATYIAENYLESPERYTEYRRMFGYTGFYRGVPVSVQASGMGCPSVSIVAEELCMLGVGCLVRVGTCGGLSPDLRFGDLVVATGAWGVGHVVRQIAGCPEFAPEASHRLVRYFSGEAEKVSARHKIGPVCTTDLFYHDDAAETYPRLARLGCLAMEMEAAALFSIAAKRNVEAACLLTVSDLIGDPENPRRAAEDVITDGVDRMVRVALEGIFQRHAQNQSNLEKNI